jgi:hypothetical protein
MKHSIGAYENSGIDGARERERERERVCVHMCVRACVCACARTGMCVRVLL